MTVSRCLPLESFKRFKYLTGEKWLHPAEKLTQIKLLFDHFAIV